MTLIMLIVIKRGISTRMGNETVLLVEDEPAVRNLGAYVLRDQGYTVLDAGNGNEALRLAAEFGEQDIHLLFTDVVMPMMGGVELAQLLKSHHRDLRVVFTSGYAYGLTVPPEDLQGESTFLEKPYTPDGMSWKIREALDTPLDSLQDWAGESRPVEGVAAALEEGGMAGRGPATGAPARLW